MLSVKAVLRYVLLPLLGLMLVLLLTLAGLLLTEGGSRWLLTQVRGLVPGELAIGQISGNLARELQLRDIRWQQGELSLQSESLTLRWRPLRLLAGELLIEQLALGDTEVHLPPPSTEPEAPPATEPFQLPEQLALPLAVELRSLGLQRIAVYSASSEQPLQQLNSAQLIASLREGQLQLQQLQVSVPQADLALEGRATLGQGYPFELTTQWTVHLDNLLGRTAPDPAAIQSAQLSGSGTLQGLLQGDLSQLSLQQQLSGAAQAELALTLEHPLAAASNDATGTALRWQAQIALQRLEMAALLPEASPELLNLQPQAELQAQGDLESAQLTLVASATLPELQRSDLKLTAQASLQQIEISELSLQPQQGSARLGLQGKLEDPLGQRRVQAQLNWKDLRYPLASDDTDKLATAADKKPAAGNPAEAELAPALVSSGSGQLTLDGTLDAYRLQLKTALNGANLPAIELTASGEGNSEGLQLEPLQAATLGGQIRLNGKAGWAPQPSWDLGLTLENLTPALQWPDLPGTISAKLRSQGKIDQELQAQVQIESLSGALQGQPLQGRGEVQVQGSAVQIDRLALGWGDAELQANGRVAEQLALQWQLKVPDLSKLLPAAAGRIAALGTLQGARQLPAVDADLTLEGLRYGANQVAELQARLGFDPSWQQDADIRLSASKLVAGGQQIDSAELSIGGSEQQLQLALAAEGSQIGQLSLKADGQLRTRLQQTPLRWSWDGKLTALDLSNPQSGPWRLQAATPISANQDRFKLEPLCLRPREMEGVVCVDAAGTLGQAAMQLQAGARIDQLSLALLEPFIPDPTQLQGQVDAEASYQLNGAKSRYSLSLRLPKAQFSLPDSDLTLSLDRSELTLNGDQNTATAKLDLPLDPLQGGINGSVRVQDLSGAQRLSGQLNAQLERLKPLVLLVPDLQIEQGRLQGQLNLGGTLAAPALSGNLALQEGEVELPAAGIRVSALNLDLRDDPAREGEMLLTGSAKSGAGDLALEGRIQPLQQRAELNLKGERFEAVNSTEVHLLVSPDLQLALSPQQVRVRGEVSIPQALIQTPKLEQGAVSGSTDLVVNTGSEADAARGPEIDVDMRLVLGDSVRVDAFGFNGLLTGALKLQQQGGGIARGSGSVGVASGQYRLYGQDLNITRGNVVFTGGPLSNPGLDLRVGRDIDDVTVGALVSGTLRKPQLNLTSSPAMPDNSILSYLLLGRAPNSNSSGEQQMLMKLALSLGAKGGTSITEKLTQSLNLDDIGFASGDTVDDTSFYIGKYLSPELYIKYGIGLINPVNTFLMRYQLSKRLALESETSAEGSGGDLIYSFERN